MSFGIGNEELSGFEQTEEVHSTGNMREILFSCPFDNLVHGENAHHRDELNSKHGQITQGLSNIPSVLAISNSE